MKGRRNKSVQFRSEKLKLRREVAPLNAPSRENVKVKYSVKKLSKPPFKKISKGWIKHRKARVSKQPNIFKVDEAYRKSLPDLMQTENSIGHKRSEIQHVGISNFRLPIQVMLSPGEAINVDASVIGSVSLGAHLRGINMSRIIRSFYKFKDEVFSVDSLADILKSYKKELRSESARIKVSFSFPDILSSLRSRLDGYQYYDAAFEASIDVSGNLACYTEFDFVYCSACPCSSELAEHARETRDVYSIPHSQRSKAKIRIQSKQGQFLSLLELKDLCQRALMTETQVIVRREDEQAFAELNGSHCKFVEDAARLLHEQLEKNKRVIDFEVFCVHYESLHSFDAVSALCKGIKGGMQADLYRFGPAFNS